MKTLVVYESMFGNTREIAEAVADGLREWSEVVVADVDHAPRVLDPATDLVVAGGPTHAFSMSRESTRHSAVTQGAQHPTSTGLREWLGGLHTAGATRIATFDTHASQRWIPGSAGKAAAKEARTHGLSVVSTESFYVQDMQGPLADGETARAREWGAALAGRLDS